MTAICAQRAAVSPSAAPSSSQDGRLTPELFAQARQAWKAAAHAKTLSASSIAAWALLRGADPSKGFAPVTNPRKLANGQAAWAARDGALSSCSRLSTSALEPWAALLRSQGAQARMFDWEAGDNELLLALQTAAERSAR